MTFRYHRSYIGGVQAVILDWAGTTVDFGSFAPTAVFVRLFERHGVAITPAHARSGMGLMKKDHLRAILQLPEVRAAWEAVHGAPAGDADVDRLYADFEPLQIDVVADYARPIPGLLETVAFIRSRGWKIGTTTGYTRPMMEALAQAARAYGYEPDAIVTPSDAPAGRPYPWMCYKLAIDLQVYPMAAMVKVGDTLPDVEEGLNAGMWTVGVALTGNMVGLSEAEFAQLSAEEVAALRREAGARFLTAGAHYVIDSIADLPPVLERIDARVRNGEEP
ncbi:phosphonoacetaldehyde hydrolase [Caldilinea sp.]|uniref:phosphonoacetaldehyde hydrolase n=1 Tax=Caldilinea sp. TaxID=2293560 RepID=UPI0021DD96BF|nr:phosphonoacetaldehyde hydrolase [Caldilinea sp.]GIV70050.1 MAG: phosphonoacetaldehyde hydrolase [Caldilinea sp.]